MAENGIEVLMFEKKKNSYMSKLTIFTRFTHNLSPCAIKSWYIFQEYSFCKF